MLVEPVEPVAPGELSLDAADHLDLAPLARLAVDVQADAGARPQLWRRLHAEGLWLAVLDAEAGDAGIEIRLLTSRRDGAAFVLGGSNEDQLAGLVGDRIDEVRLVHAPGHHLPRIWPSGHHLVLDAGTHHAVVLTPGEMSGLPRGPMVGHTGLPDLPVTDADPTDWRQSG